MRMRQVGGFVLLAAALVAATGCSKVTRANYDRIERGMSFEEVEAILGAPTETESVGIGPLSATTARWEGRDGTISIQFVNDEVKVKRFLGREEGG